MKGQGGLILGLIAAIVISIFAIINVEAVRVNYLFGVAEWPLILVILGSVLMGAIIAGALAMVRFHQLRSEMKRLRLAAKQQHSEHIDRSEKEAVQTEVREESELENRENN